MAGIRTQRRGAENAEGAEKDKNSDSKSATIYK